MSTYRIPGPWSGSLAIISRPRGGDWIERLLSSGRNVGIHCRQSIGRSGMSAAALLVMAGSSGPEAIEVASQGRGLPVPETRAQTEWIFTFEREVAPSPAQQ